MTDEEEGKIKTFSFWLLLNWKTEDIKLYKKQPQDKKVGAYNIPVEVSLDVEIPDKPDIKAKGKIKLGQDKIDDMVIEHL